MSNDKDHIVFDQSHELMKKDHLEHLYFKMCREDFILGKDDYVLQG
jgi:hypothetical protein